MNTEDRTRLRQIYEAAQDDHADEDAQRKFEVLAYILFGTLLKSDEQAETYRALLETLADDMQTSLDDISERGGGGEGPSIYQWRRAILQALGRDD